MDFDNTASTPETTSTGSAESAPASASSPDVTTPQAVPAPVPDVNTPAPGAASIEAGWSLEDETVSETPVPENDDDLAQLTNDPALDQGKVPGLVQAIRDARAGIRTKSSELAQARQELTQLHEQFAPYGGLEGAQAYLQAVNGLLQAPQAENGANGFLDTLYSEAYPVFERLVSDAVAGSPDIALKVLEERGLLPAKDAQPLAAGGLDAETLASIPEHLRQIARSLPASVQQDLSMQPEDVRNFILEREAKFAQMDAQQQQQAREQWQQQVTQARQQGESAVTELHQQYEQANLDILRKWQPYGPDGKDANERVYAEMVEGAMAELLRDPQWARMYQDIQARLVQAPMRRLNREGMAAEADERQARQDAARLNVRLGQLLRERVKERADIYADARKWREQQRSQIPQRTEIGGPATQAGQSSGVPYTKNGRINPDYIQELASRYGGG